MKENKETICDKAAKEAVKMPAGVVAKHEGFPNKYKEGEYFVIEEGGVYRSSKPGASDEKKVRVCSRLDVVAQTHDEKDEDCGLRLQFRTRGGRLKTLSVSMSEVLSSGFGLVQKLAAGGLPFCLPPGSRGMAAINQYILSVPDDGMKDIKTVSGGGWTNKSFSCFVLEGGLTVRTEAGDYAELAVGAKAARVQQQGTLEEWQQSFKEVFPHSPISAFVVCVALAAPVLRIVEGQSRIFNLYGLSSSGKSSAIKLGATVWGRPEGRGGWIRSWNSTKNALIELAQQSNDLPLFLDELTESGGASSSISYSIGNGQGRSRCGRDGNLQESREWLTYVLSTGEGALDEIKQMNCRGRAANVATGELVRFIDIPVQDEDNGAGVFESFPDDVKPGDRAAWIDAHCGGCQSYGWAGIEFLKHLEADIQQQGVKEFTSKFNERAASFKKEVACSGKDSAMQRVLQSFAIVAAAGELAISYGVLPLAEGKAREAARKCFMAWSGSANTPAAQKEKFLAALRNDPQENVDRYQIYNSDAVQVGRGSGIEGAYGRVLLDGTFDDSEPILALFSAEQFKNLIRRKGITEAVARTAIKEAGLFYVNAAKGSYRVRRSGKNAKDGLPLGLINGSAYKAIVLAVDDEGRVDAGRVDSILEHIALCLRSEKEVAK